MKLQLIPQDKANHFVYGNIIAFLFLFFLTPLLTFLLVLLIALGKEYYDYKTKTGTPEVMDVIWTLLGSLTLIIPHIGLF